MKHLSFRESTESDFNFVFELNKINMRKYVEKIRGWNEKFEREDMKNKFTPGVDKIIQIDGVDAGTLGITEKDDSIRVEHIELLPQFQNQGFGTEILKNILNRGKTTTLRVLKTNPAINLYKRLGFKIIGETDLKYEMSTG